MVKTRQAPRFRVSKPALIERGGDTTRCTIRDISTTGAALQFSDRADGLPSVFTLTIPEDNLKLGCRVVWRASFRMGVAFD
jgi:hypothetical protein